MNSTKDSTRIDVSRGPNWLFLRLESEGKPKFDELADQVWAVVSKHFVYRVVLEFGAGSLPDEAIVQLDEIRRRLEEHDGALRVCGLDQATVKKLEAECADSKMRSRLTSHSTRAGAVFGVDDAHTDLPGGQHAEAEPITQDIAYEALRVH